MLQVNYGARGWVVHHKTDIWAKSSPVSGEVVWAMWAMGGAWLCTHLWEHYKYTMDKVVPMPPCSVEIFFLIYRLPFLLGRNGSMLISRNCIKLQRDSLTRWHYKVSERSLCYPKLCVLELSLISFFLSFSLDSQQLPPLCSMRDCNRWH